MLWVGTVIFDGDFAAQDIVDDLYVEQTQGIL